MSNYTCPCGSPAYGRRKTCNPCYTRTLPKSPCIECGLPTGTTRKGTKCFRCCGRQPNGHTPEHGTRKMYRDNKCRCDICREAHNARQREFVAKHRERTGESIYRHYRKPDRHSRVKQKLLICENCGGECSVASGSPQRFCSNICSQNARYGRKISRCTELEVYTGPRNQRKPKINKNPVPKRVGTMRSGRCRVCGKCFTSFLPTLTCSDKCRKKYQKSCTKARHRERMATDPSYRGRHKSSRRRAEHRRRAIANDAFVEDVYLFVLIEMDDGICIICDEQVDLKAIAPDPNAPTIEHYIPLHRGGEHSYANCGLAHFICNSRKTDKTPDEYRSWCEAVPA